MTHPMHRVLSILGTPSSYSKFAAPESSLYQPPTPRSPYSHSPPSSPLPLKHPMYNINNLRKQPPDAILNQRLKAPNRLLLTNTQREPLPDLLHRLIRLGDNIRDICVRHEGKEVEDQVGGFAKGGVGREAVLLEGGVVGGVGAAHGVDHDLRELDGGRHGFRVAAEDVAEVDVAEVACGRGRLVGGFEDGEGDEGEDTVWG